jgi:hypothetical protein
VSVRDRQTGQPLLGMRVSAFDPLIIFKERFAFCGQLLMIDTGQVFRG